MANPNKRSSFDKMTTFVNLNHIKGPRGLKYFHYVRSFQKNILESFTQVNREYGDIASFPWPMNSVIIYDPALIKVVLSDKNRDYIKGEQIEELRAVVGDGLATNNHYDSWLKSRKLLAKEFNNKSVATYFDDFVSLTIKQSESWKNETIIDLCQEMKALTFHIACQTILGGSLPEDKATLVDEAVSFTSIVTYQRIFEFFPIPYWAPTKKNFEFNRHYNNLERIVNEIIEETRKEVSSTPKSILEKLVFAKDEETNFSFNDIQLRDEVLTLMLAGHETSAHSLTWVLGLLAKHQSVQDSLYEELKYHQFKINNLEELPVLNAVLNEAMRLYPAFPVLSRKTLVDTQLGPYKLPKDTNVVIPIYVTQRNESNWPKAKEFHFDRFLDEKNLKNYRHLPFGKGPRRCIAELFALQEMRIIIQCLLKEFRFELSDSGFPKETAFVSLKPIGGMPLKVFRRD